MPAAREPVQSRAHRTRAALLAAAERDFDERGYAQTTTKSIAERAGVAAGSFYQYFTDKDAVLRELARVRMDGLRSRLQTIGAPAIDTSLPIADIERAARRGLRELIDEVIQYHRLEPGLHAVLSERRNADAELDAMTRESEHTSVAGIEAMLQLFGFTGDRKATAFVIFGLIEGSVHSHVIGTRVVSDKRFIEALSNAVVAIVKSELDLAGRQP
jgi:AcrR family transcriptional regulator